MILAYKTITPEVRAIRSTLNYSGTQYTVDLLDKDGVELRDLDAGWTLYGWRSVFTYVSRCAHTMPSDPTSAALVERWVSAPWIEADAEQRSATLDDLEAALAAHGQTFLCDDELKLSTAADFLWVPRLADLLAAGKLDKEARPCLVALAQQDPSLDDRGHESEDEDESTPPSPDVVRSACVLM